MEINEWYQLQSQFQAPDQDWHSSSSSSLRSLSASSPESSPLFNTMPTTTSFSQTPILPYDAYNIQSLNPECDNAVIMKAMLAVISSPSPASSTSSQSFTSQKSPPFKEYTSALATNSPNSGKQQMLKRSISRNTNLSLIDELADDSHHTSSSQLHHKISERMRRVKLNQSLQELRSLLPPGSKKDKASVLSSTLDYMTNLKTEVMDLQQKNDVLEARASNMDGTSDEKVNVQIISAPTDPWSEEQEIEVQVTVRGDCDVIDLTLDILEYLKDVNEATLLSMDANTKPIRAEPINGINFRLKIKKSGWDQAAFQEAMDGIVSNVAI